LKFKNQTVTFIIHLTFTSENCEVWRHKTVWAVMHFTANLLIKYKSTLFRQVSSTDTNKNMNTT